jgi:hypothetical protein
MMQVLYAQAASQLSASNAAGGGGAGAAAAAALPVLYTDGFDVEQVWQQLCMQYGPLVARSKRLLKKVRPSTPTTA